MHWLLGHLKTKFISSSGLLTTSICFHFSCVGFPQRRRDNGKGLCAKPAEGIHGKGGVHLPFARTLSQLSKALRALWTWKALRDSVSELFSLPWFTVFCPPEHSLPLYTQGCMQPAAGGASFHCGSPKSCSESPWRSKVDGSASPRPALPSLATIGNSRAPTDSELGFHGSQSRLHFWLRSAPAFMPEPKWLPIMR